MTIKQAMEVNRQVANYYEQIKAGEYVQIHEDSAANSIADETDETVIIDMMFSISQCLGRRYFQLAQIIILEGRISIAKTAGIMKITNHELNGMIAVLKRTVRDLMAGKDPDMALTLNNLDEEFVTRKKKLKK